MSQQEEHFQDSEVTPHRSRKPVYDPTINLGHVLTFIGFMIMIFTTWTTLDKRVVILEEARKSQEAMDKVQDQRADQLRAELKDTLSEVRRALERLNDKLDGVAPHVLPQSRKGG